MSGSTRIKSLGDYFSWREMGLFAVVYLVGISHGYVMTVVLLGLFAWSFTGVTQAIMAMSLVALFKFANGAVASFSPYSTLLFWLITMAASLRLYQSARHISLPFVLLLSFAIVAILLSAMVSKAPDVSVMKVVSFFVVSAAMLLSAQTLKASEVEHLQRWFFSIALVIALLSLLTIPFAGIGFQKNATSLQGMFNHPQAAGVFYVPFAAWFIARIFLEPFARLPKWLPWIASLFAGLIVASWARTAMLATFVGVAVTLLIVLIEGRTGAATRSRGAIIGFASVLFSLSVALLLSGVLNEELQSIVFKGDDTAGIEEAFQSSRGAGMAQHLQNFRDAPLTGHGFGVYREGVGGGEDRVVRFLGIPISAPVEKGIVFTSVLEEVGIVGALLFYGLLVSIVAAVAKSPSPGALAMVVGCVAVNFGEAIFFSTGGMGLFMWLLIGFSLARARFSGAAMIGADVADRPAAFPSNIMP